MPIDNPPGADPGFEHIGQEEQELELKTVQPLDRAARQVMLYGQQLTQIAAHVRQKATSVFMGRQVNRRETPIKTDQRFHESVDVFGFQFTTTIKRLERELRGQAPHLYDPI